MRITGGAHRGRKLFSPEDYSIRPTSDRVKEALFSILYSRISGASFLDCFAGSGAVGLEALSRGAKDVAFVEKNRKAAALILKNANLIDLQIEIHNDDFFIVADNLGKMNRKYDFVFIDPPYAKREQVRAVLKIDSTGLLDARGTVIVEHDKRELTSDNIGKLNLTDCRNYGETCLSFYQHIGNK